ncbi:ribonuclease P protein subunit p30 [Pelomyxa schiedti]|nr:ribonuclease P protein subunit p30 [Pelomyxa schiedti]
MRRKMFKAREKRGTDRFWMEAEVEFLRKESSYVISVSEKTGKLPANSTASGDPEEVIINLGSPYKAFSLESRHSSALIGEHPDYCDVPAQAPQVICNLMATIKTVQKKKKNMPFVDANLGSEAKLVRVAWDRGWDLVICNHTIVGADAAKRLSSASSASSLVEPMMAPALPAEASVREAIESADPQTALKLMPVTKRRAVLRRLTFVLSNESQIAAFRKVSQDPCWDVIAVLPTTIGTLSLCCNTLEVDIISLDASQRWVGLRAAGVHGAIERGIYFELCTAQAMTSQMNSRTLVANALELMLATKKKNVLLSSGAREEPHIHTPRDMINLGVLFGLTEQQAKYSITQLPLMALAHCKMRKLPVSHVLGIQLTGTIEKSEKCWQLPEPVNTVRQNKPAVRGNRTERTETGWGWKGGSGGSKFKLVGMHKTWTNRLGTNWKEKGGRVTQLPKRLRKRTAIQTTTAKKTTNTTTSTTTSTNTTTAGKKASNTTSKSSPHARNKQTKPKE